MSVFSGDSFQKKKIRDKAYSQIKKDDLINKMHIVIASRMCGDIRYLLDKGVPEDHIIACDTDPLAVIEAAKFGVVISPHGTIQDTVRWAVALFGVTEIASVNVDLCKTVKQAAPILRDVWDATSSKSEEGLFYPHPRIFLTCFRARDGLRSSEAREDFLLAYLGITEDVFTEWGDYVGTGNSPMSCSIW